MGIRLLYKELYREENRPMLHHVYWVLTEPLFSIKVWIISTLLHTQKLFQALWELLLKYLPRFGKWYPWDSRIQKNEDLHLTRLMKNIKFLRVQTKSRYMRYSETQCETLGPNIYSVSAGTICPVSKITISFRTDTTFPLLSCNWHTLIQANQTCSGNKISLNCFAFYNTWFKCSSVGTRSIS